MICLSKLATKVEPYQNSLPVTQTELLLDLIALPVFLLSRDRQLIYANAAGHENLNTENIVQLRCGRFHLKASTHQIFKFEQSLRSVTSGGLNSDCHQNCIVVQNAAGSRVSITMLPFANSSEDSALAAVILTAEESSEEQGTLRLQHMFNLTFAEARVAYHVSAGLKLTLIAERLEVSINTVKTHLASVFSKTGCADQSTFSVLARRLMTPVRNSWLGL
jgi:DNA-binding CsgD family transcriptional regulator